MTKFIFVHGVRTYSVLATLVPALLIDWPKVSWEVIAAASAGRLGADTKCGFCMQIVDNEAVS
ncbi:hypothetical protein LRE75_26075 [Streptomyces sp. 372A]